MIDLGDGDRGFFAEVAECGDLGFGFEPRHEPAGNARHQVLTINQRNKISLGRTISIVSKE